MSAPTERPTRGKRQRVDGRAVNLFTFTVSDLSRLRALMRGRQKLDGIFEVERV